MKRWGKVALWSVGIPVGAVIGSLALLFLVAPTSDPTQGPKIGTYASPRTALLVIDLQEDYTGPDAKQHYRDADKIISETNELIVEAQSQGNMVVFIENTFANPIFRIFVGGMNAPGAPGTEMDRRLIRIPGTRTFVKQAADAFSTPELETFLRGNQVNHVLIAGLDGIACVDATARGALNRGYEVTMIPKAIAIHGKRPMGKLVQGWREAGATVI
jgi:nicotinamidase-related amidase